MSYGCFVDFIDGLIQFLSNTSRLSITAHRFSGSALITLPLDRYTLVYAKIMQVRTSQEAGGGGAGRGATG